MILNKIVNSSVPSEFNLICLAEYLERKSARYGDVAVILSEAVANSVDESTDGTTEFNASSRFTDKGLNKAAQFTFNGENFSYLDLIQHVGQVSAWTPELLNQEVPLLLVGYPQDDPIWSDSHALKSPTYAELCSMVTDSLSGLDASASAIRAYCQKNVDKLLYFKDKVEGGATMVGQAWSPVTEYLKELIVSSPDPSSFLTGLSGAIGVEEAASLPSQQDPFDVSATDFFKYTSSSPMIALAGSEAFDKADGIISNGFKKAGLYLRAAIRGIEAFSKQLVQKVNAILNDFDDLENIADNYGASCADMTIPVRVDEEKISNMEITPVTIYAPTNRTRYRLWKNYIYQLRAYAAEIFDRQDYSQAKYMFIGPIQVCFKPDNILALNVKHSGPVEDFDGFTGDLAPYEHFDSVDILCLCKSNCVVHAMSVARLRELWPQITQTSPLPGLTTPAWQLFFDQAVPVLNDMFKSSNAFARLDESEVEIANGFATSCAMTRYLLAMLKAEWTGCDQINQMSSEVSIPNGEIFQSMLTFNDGSGSLEARFPTNADFISMTNAMSADDREEIGATVNGLTTQECAEITFFAILSWVAAEMDAETSPTAPSYWPWTTNVSAVPAPNWRVKTTAEQVAVVDRIATIVAAGVIVLSGVAVASFAVKAVSKALTRRALSKKATLDAKLWNGEKLTLRETWAYFRASRRLTNSALLNGAATAAVRTGADITIGSSDEWTRLYAAIVGVSRS